MANAAIKWTEVEILKLRQLWPSSIDASDLVSQLGGRSPKAINLKAGSLKLTKIDDVIAKKNVARSERQALTNKMVLGRDLSDENLKNIAAQYHSRTHFARADISAYSTARKRKILDSICSHMLVNITHNFPQTFLFHLAGNIFDDQEIRFNDRTAIYPKEIDVYIPKMLLGIEYDGLNFHQNLNIDQLKDQICENKGIRLIRIKEKNKANPIPNIVGELQKQLRIIIPESLVSAAQEKTLKSFVSKAELEATCANYTDLVSFRKSEPMIVKLLMKNNLFDAYTSHMVKRYLSPDEKFKRVKSTLSAVKSKSEFRTLHRPDYSCLMKNKTSMASLLELYRSLPHK